jgi:hypothetical protein
VSRQPVFSLHEQENGKTHCYITSKESETSAKMTAVEESKEKDKERR